VLLGVIGASLLYGDGVITPAISVLSAMEGLKLVAPGFEKIHRAGDAGDPDRPVRDPAPRHRKHRKAVRPVMVVWFVVIGVLGATNVVKAPAILWRSIRRRPPASSAPIR